MATSPKAAGLNIGFLKSVRRYLEDIAIVETAERSNIPCTFETLIGVIRSVRIRAVM